MNLKFEPICTCGTLTLEKIISTNPQYQPDIWRCESCKKEYSKEWVRGFETGIQYCFELLKGN